MKLLNFNKKIASGDNFRSVLPPARLTAKPRAGRLFSVVGISLFEIPYHKSNRKSSQCHFDTVASSCEYDRGISIEMARQVFLEEYLEGKVVLDLGCGIVGGREQFFLSEKRAAMYIGADLSFKNLQISKEISPDTLVVQADISSPPFKMESIDIIYCHGVMTYVHDMDKAIRSALALMKKGGKIFIDFSKKNYIVAAIQIFSYFLGRFPIFLKRWLARIFLVVLFPFMRIIIGEKARWGNRTKMYQVLMSSLFSPVRIKAVKEKYIQDLFKDYGAVNTCIMNIPDNEAYSNATTFTVMAEK